MISFPKRVLHFFSNSSASILSTQKRVPISFTVSSKSNKSSLPSDPINWLSSNQNHEVQRFDCSHVARRCPRVGGSTRWSRVHRCTGGSHLIRVDPTETHEPSVRLRSCPRIAYGATRACVRSVARFTCRESHSSIVPRLFAFPIRTADPTATRSFTKQWLSTIWGSNANLIWWSILSSFFQRNIVSSSSSSSSKEDLERLILKSNIT